MAGRGKGGRAEADVRESAARARRAQPALAETAQRVDRAELRASVRDRRHEASPPARAEQHPQAAAGAWCRVQSLADPAEAYGSRQASAVAGAFFATF